MTESPQTRSQHALRRFLYYVRPFRGYLTVSVSATVLYVILSALLIWLIGPLVATLFGGSPVADITPAPETTGLSGWFSDIKETILNTFERLIVRADSVITLTRMCVAIILISFAKNILLYLQNFLIAIVQQRLIRKLRDQLFAHYQDLSMAYFARTRTGQVISRVTNDVRVLNDMLDLGFTRMIKEPLLVVLLLASLFIISWQLALITITVLPLTTAVMVTVGWYVRRYSRRSQECMADLHSVLEEAVGGIRVVKAFGMQDFEVGRFRNINNAFYRAMLKMARVRKLNSPINEFLGTIAGVTILYFGGRAVLGGEGLIATEFITFVFLVFSLIQPIKGLAEIHAKLQEGRAAAERVFEALDTPVDIVDCPGARPMAEFTDCIRYEDVTFAYDPGRPVLRDISLDVPRGSSIALVGPSGGGKSTLCDLLVRFYDPDKGRITIDGVDLRDITINSLRAHLGIVTQDIILFNDTVARNIAYGYGTIDHDKLREAARAAQALEFIEALPQGFETVVGTRGVKLSGGQRQRIAIARAIMKDPPILIFDEATSALDTESEVAVRRAIENLLKDRTALIVAHRLSTVRDADRIVVVDNGRIVDAGKHNELLARGGLYRRLHDMQFDDSLASTMAADDVPVGQQ